MRRRPWTAIAVASGLVLAGGVAYASIPDAGGLIHGCYKTNGGSLRVIDLSAGEVCNASEKPLGWSQTGPPGPRGTTGQSGSTGTTGARGPTGTTGASGPTGTPGAKGASGATGATGTAGPAGQGVKTIAGLVASTGAVASGSGYSVTHTATGHYQVTFPPGTWNDCLQVALTATPDASTPTAVRVTGHFCVDSVTSVISLTFESIGSNPVPVDSAFDFVAAQP